MDGCAIIDARRRESVETGLLWRANAATTGKVQTGAWKSRLHSGNTEQDMRNALVKSFMCDHYSKTMHWAATDRDPARYGIHDRSEYWLHRPSPTFQHRERAFFSFSCREREKNEWDQTIAPPPSPSTGHAPPQRMARQRQSRACSSGTSKTSIKASQQSSDTTMERSGLRT